MENIPTRRRLLKASLAGAAGAATVDVGITVAVSKRGRTFFAKGYGLRAHGLFPDQDISVSLLTNEEITTPAIEQSVPKVFDAVKEVW